MRCLTLADALRRRGAQVRFISRHMPVYLRDMLTTNGIEFASLESDAEPTPLDELAHAQWLGTGQVQDSQDTIRILSDKTWDWLIVDHYALDIRWENALRGSTKKIMVIDDIADRRHDCDLLLDQNFYSDMEKRYENLVPSQCVKLLGPKYALLRPEFRKARENLRKRDGRVSRIFVFFGGSDPTNETAKALEAIRLLGRPDIAVDVVVGAANSHQDVIAAICESMPNTAYHCQVDNVAQLMANADLAIGAGGSANWERCCLGLPSIIFSLADNQSSGSEAIALWGAHLYLGKREKVDTTLLLASLEIALASPQLLQRMSDAGYAILDGKGAERVSSRILSQPIEFRPAEKKDCDMIFNWRNADESRYFSSSTEPIPYETHVSWFDNALLDRDRAILIGEIDGEPAGVIRYDRKDERAIVSVYLVPGCKGKGLGVELISGGNQWIENYWQIKTIDALINAENVASIGAFEAAGFRKKNCVYSKFVGS